MMLISFDTYMYVMYTLYRIENRTFVRFSSSQLYVMNIYMVITLFCEYKIHIHIFIYVKEDMS